MRRRGNTKGNHPVLFQKKPGFIVMYRAIASKAKGFNGKAPDKGFPFSYPNAVLGHYGVFIFNYRNICGSSAHVNNDAVFFSGKVNPPGNTGRGPGEQSLHRVQVGKGFGHKASVAANNNGLWVDIALTHGLLDGFQKFPDNREKPGVQEST